MSCYKTISVKYASLLQLVKLLRSSVTAINTRTLDELLKGINVNEKVTIDCRTPLHLAAAIKCENTSLAALKIVLQHAANPNIPNEEGNTALHIAASLGHRLPLRLLICNGGDLLQCNIKGETPIDVAFSAGFPYISSFLSKLLDAESFETCCEPKFQKFLWNRQLREVAPNYRDSVPLAACCSLCSKSFTIKKNSGSFSGFSTIEMEESILSSTSRRNSILNSTSRRKSILSSTSRRNSILSSTGRKNVVPTPKSRLTSSSILDNTKEGEDFQAFLSHLNDCYSHGFSNKENFDDSIGYILNHRNNCLKALDPSINTTKELFSRTTSKIFQNSENNIENSCDSFFTALTSICGSSKCPSSFITVVEEYIYKDENGIELIERIFPPSLCTTRTSVSMFSDRSGIGQSINTLQAKSKNHGQDSIGTLTESILGLSGEELRLKLKDLGYVAGPITPFTFRTLQRHFQRLRRNKTRQSLNKPIMVRYSRELEYFCNNQSTSLTHYEELEMKMCEPFLAPDELSCWRSGIQKNCFNYLLLDPRVSRNLPLRKDSLPVKDLFRNFLNAVFYIGKGSRARPYYHFYEALSENKSKSLKNKSKVSKIKDIWNEGLGVISLHIFQSSIPVESWTREACMIASFGPDNLCNRIQGTCYGPASTWRKKDQREIGSFCLFKAFNLLLFEGERQIRPRDISIPKWMKKE